MPAPYRKKLIEVALPLAEINDASAFDKRPGIGAHPKGVHHWWAPLPMPVARAVLFASVVNDPSDDPAWANKSEDEQNQERDRLFGILKRLMQKKLHDKPEVYAEARKEMKKHCASGELPPVLDPFAGGGSIPLEANRLGFPARAADSNPVAVLINKCKLEIIPRWLNQAPVNPDDRGKLGGDWRGACGLAADVRYYGNLIRDRLDEQIGHLYPKVAAVQDKDGKWRHATSEDRETRANDVRELNVIAWLWARTVASPSPAVRGAHVPLVSSFWLCSKKESPTWLRPKIDEMNRTFDFEVCHGEPEDKISVRAGTKLGRGIFKCIFTGFPIDNKHLRQQAALQKLEARLTAIVVELPRGRTYLSPLREHEVFGRTALNKWKPEELVTTPCHDVDRLPMYGMPSWGDAFTPRQITALTGFADAIKSVAKTVKDEARAAGRSSSDADDYSAAVVTFLSLALDRCAESSNSLCRWDSSAAGQRVKNLFGRQAIPMLWDFAEANILGEVSVCWLSALDITVSSMEAVPAGSPLSGICRQIDAATSWNELSNLLISTDPPYYDNIGYAALSDFFYVWLRRTVGDLYPDLFSTILVPKIPELTAASERFGGDKEKARVHFEEGFRKAFTGLREKMNPEFPLTVYYAFKQDDDDSGDEQDDDSGSAVDLTTGWETLLNSLITSRFQVTGTWPVRASQQWKMNAMAGNALLSYVVLVCRQRPESATVATRREFVQALSRELPPAIRELQHGNILPVDLPQSALGPGMAVFSRYAKVLESNGGAMSVRTAMQLINQAVDEFMSGQEAEQDAWTRWGVRWFASYGFASGPYDDAYKTANPLGVSVESVEEAGLIELKLNQVRLLRAAELPEGWDPRTDARVTVWEALHHMIKAVESGGLETAAVLMKKCGSGLVEHARLLCYRLFALCEKNRWSEDGRPYNGLITEWPRINDLAQNVVLPEKLEQGTMNLT